MQNFCFCLTQSDSYIPIRKTHRMQTTFIIIYIWTDKQYFWGKKMMQEKCNKSIQMVSEFMFKIMKVHNRD